MKKIIVFAFFFISVTTLSQGFTTQDTVIRFGITELGKPDGEKAEMKIGKEGGSFTSSDGKIRLIIPEGAVSKKTTFSIQPTTNLAPNGNGKAYRMEPSGINFQQPAQIIFYYADNEIEGNSPDLMGIATQNEKGLWSSLNQAAIYTVSKTLKADIRHFSSFVNYLKAKIDPSSAKVKINGSLRLKIIYTADPDDDLLTPLAGNEINDAEVWSVNGIPKGNSDIGLISVSQNKSAIFQAPAQLPQQNPVAVSVQASYSGKRYNVRRLVSNITIYDDGYEVKMESRIVSGSKEAWGGITTAIDQGSFIVSLENNKPAVINIKNNLEVKTDDCTNILQNPTTCTGLLHVAGIKDIKVTPANPPGQPYPIVEISFVPFPIEFSIVKFLCPPPPGAGDGWSSGNQLEKMKEVGLPQGIGRALPWDIKFFAKDGEQIIIESPKDSDDGYLKIWVRKVKVD